MKRILRLRMNHAVKKIIILQSIFLIGCGSQSLIIDTYIPSPLVAKNNDINAVILYEDELNDFTFMPQELQQKEATLEIKFGDTQVKLFENIFSSFFTLERDLQDNQESLSNLQIDISLDKFEYLTPQMAANQKYSVWFKYNIKFSDSSMSLIDNWIITGYGEQETGVFQGDEAFSRAIQIALRDTGANLSIKTQNEIDNILKMIG